MLAEKQRISAEQKRVKDKKDAEEKQQALERNIELQKQKDEKKKQTELNYVLKIRNLFENNVIEYVCGKENRTEYKQNNLALLEAVLFDLKTNKDEPKFFQYVLEYLTVLRGSGCNYDPYREEVYRDIILLENRLRNDRQVCSNMRIYWPRSSSDRGMMSHAPDGSRWNYYNLQKAGYPVP